jgi:hypothetical protein
VVAPIMKNEKNLHKYPQCVADDIMRQVGAGFIKLSFNLPLTL